MRFGKLLAPNRRSNAPTVSPDPVVADLSRKLRAGFSRYACNDLDEIVRSSRTGAQRTFAAWELARFHAGESQWDKALFYLGEIHEADVGFLRKNRAGPLYVEALPARGRLGDAERLTHDLIDELEIGGDLRGALSNVINARPDGQAKTVGAGSRSSNAMESAAVPGASARSGRHEHYDVIIISDLTLLGGTRRCNEGYIAAAIKLGMRVGLFHWARYDLRLKDDIAKEYRALSDAGNVHILAAPDRLSTDLVLIHHPPILKYVPDVVPAIDTKHLAILVNQLPQRCGEDGVYYQRDDVEGVCSKLFGVPAVWIPISPIVRRVLSEAGFAPLAKEDWIPPLGTIVPIGDRARATDRKRRQPVIGRHSRDHWTKWPEVESDLRRAYCADSEWPVRFLGGASSPRKLLTRWPANWKELAFDSMAVADFLDDLDFFIHFTHSAYVEEFGRNVMEAMAAGKPAVLPPRFREVFGDAASYAEPEQVEDVIRTLWDTKSAYLDQLEKGFRFVRESASSESVERRLEAAIYGIALT